MRRPSTGEYAGGIFWIVSIALIASWFVAVIFTPYLGVKLLPNFAAHHPLNDNPHAIYETGMYNRLRRIVQWCVDHRIKVVVATVDRVRRRRSQPSAACSSSSSRCPSVPSCSCSCACRKAPPSTSPPQTAKKAEKLLDDDKDITTYTTYVGQGSPRFWLGLNPQLPNESFAEIVIESKDVEARERIKARIEKAVAEGALTETRVRVDRFNFGPPVGFPVQFRVVGPDTQKVREIAYQVRDVMRRRSG